MTLTHEIYEDLFKSILTQEHDTLSKLYKTKNNFPLVFAVTRESQQRKLFFPADKTSIDRIPQCKGISICAVHLYEYSPTQIYCEIAQNRNSEGYMFEVIVESIRKNTDNIASEEKIASAVSTLLLKWKAFFAQEKELIMSPERQQGLYGELLTLQKLIGTFGAIAVSYWTGCDFETHDFYIKGNAMEVKTTSTKAPYKMHISSEYQLDDSDVTGLLFVSFYALRKSKADGETLPKIIDAVRKSVSGNSIQNKKLEVSLEAYGYFDGLEDKYSTGYHIREQHLYKIEQGFPRIIRKDLSYGISGCTYDVLVAACTHHEKKVTMVYDYLKGNSIDD